jgi:hypothetical protein
MAAPNIVNVTTITGKTAVVALTTSAQELADNAASSGKVFKINALYITNIDGTNSCDVTVNLYSQDDLGGTATALASTVAVPADSVLVLIDKNSSIYLEEDKGIGALASANSDLIATISYEEIS